MKREQRKRTRGYKAPLNCRYVGRPTKYGNPYSVNPASRLDPYSRVSAVEYYRVHVDRKLASDPHWLDELREYDYLSCFCPLDQPCHVDVLIEKLNGATK